MRPRSWAPPVEAMMVTVLIGECVCRRCLLARADAAWEAWVAS